MERVEERAAFPMYGGVDREDGISYVQIKC